MRCLRLPFTFDPEKLRLDLARVREEEWIPHMQRRHYDGQWSGAALRSIAGARDNLVPEARDGQRFADTELLARCPYFAEVLAQFRCPLLAVRLLRLHAGSNIAEHVDHALDFDDGEVRIHIPIVTSDGVRFILDGARLVLAPGECWYTNVNLPHAVENTGSVDRIHLVLDCVVDDWLREIFRTTPPPPHEHYAATLRLREPVAAAFVEAFVEAARVLSRNGQRVTFHGDRATLILQWAGRYTWQFRAQTRPAADGSLVSLESSPDPDRAHAGDFAALLEILQRRLSPTAVESSLPA
jgi:hypothetical protein